jgi:hypothetical protein
MTMNALSLAAALLLAPGLAAAGEKYAIKDAGDFVPAGQRVEFADRYGWVGYSVDFEFGLEEGSRALTRGSRLRVTIERRDGSTWTHTCKAKGRDAMSANVNFLFGKGISVVADCRIPEKAFAKAVDLDPEDVGFPNLVFQVLIQDGQVRPGSQRGVYFVPGGQIESSDLNAYAVNGIDGLAVVFRSN